MTINLQQFYKFWRGRGPLIFLLGLILLPACAVVRTVPLDYQPLARPENLNKQPIPLKVSARFRSDFQQETISFSIGNDRFVIKMGEALSSALMDATQAAFQTPAEAVNRPPEAFLEFQLATVLVDSPKSYLGDITGIHRIDYRLEIKTFLAQPQGKEIWRGTYLAQDHFLISTLFRINPEKTMGEILGMAVQKIANDFITEVLHNQAVAGYALAAKEARKMAKATGAKPELRLGFTLRPALAPPGKIGIVDLRPVEEADAIMAYDLSRYLRKELTTWGLYIFDPEDTRKSSPELYAQYWACDNLRCLVQVGKKMGYDFMIYGSVMKFRERYVFTLRLLTTEPGQDPQMKVVSAEGSFSPSELQPTLKKLTESLLAAE